MSNPPRLRTVDSTGMPVDINGVTIPVQQWTIGYPDYVGGPSQVNLAFLAEFESAEPEPDVASPADCAEESTPVVPVPRVGETVHYVDYTLPLPGQRNDLVCLPALVVRSPTWVSFEGCDEYNGGRTMLAVFNPLAGDAPQYRDARHESHPDNTGRWMTWHYADACQGAEDAPGATDCCAATPETNGCTPAPTVHLTLSGLGDTATHDVDALVRRFAKKADAAGLHLTFA